VVFCWVKCPSYLNRIAIDSKFWNLYAFFIFFAELVLFLATSSAMLSAKLTFYSYHKLSSFTTFVKEHLLWWAEFYGYEGMTQFVVSQETPTQVTKNQKTNGQKDDGLKARLKARFQSFRKCFYFFLIKSDLTSTLSSSLHV
jgi:hypothetical protein